jgi:hypothetical protein
MLKYLIIIVLLTIIPAQAQDKEKGKLGIFEDEAKGKHSDKDNDDEEIAEIVIESLDDCNDCSHFFLDGFFTFAKVMFYSREFDEHFLDNQYTPYPYYYHDAGLFGAETEKSFSIALNSQYFHHSDQLNGFLINANFAPLPQLAFQLNYADLTETLRTRYDHLRLYNFFVNYNRLRYERFTFSWGIGLKGIRGDSKINAFAFTTGIELFPVEPVSFSLQYNVGLFPLATVDEISVDVNLHHDRWRFQIGYKNFRAGRLNIGGVTMGIGIYF